VSDSAGVYGVYTGDSLTLQANEWIASSYHWSLEPANTPVRRGTVNPNAPARSDSTIYYGDTARFKASTTATAPQTLLWDFGNPQSVPAADANVVMTVTQADTPPIMLPPSQIGQSAIADHQFSGITRSICSAAPCTLPAFSIKVAGAPPSSLPSSSLSFIVTPPTVRLGITNGTTTYKYVGRSQVSTSLPIPVVKGDWLFDASDGDVEGHYSAWSFSDNGVPRSVSTFPYSGNPAAYRVPAGDCGAHTLAFAAHYGPYDQDFHTLGNVDYIETVGPFNYVVQAFAAAIDPNHPSDGSGNLMFRSISRASLDTTVLSAGQLASLNWQWDLVDAGGTVLTVGPRGTGLPASDWSVSRALLTTNGTRVRLALYLPAGVTTLCGGTITPPFGGQTSIAVSTALNGPDPLLIGGCLQNGPCHFEVLSASGIDTIGDHWHYVWSTTPGTGNSPSDSRSFDPVFTSSGTYQVTVSATVTNDVGSTVVSRGFDYTAAVSGCGTMTNANVYAIASGCPNNVCPPNAPITFYVQTNGYDMACATHTFSWDFGDGTPATSGGNSVQHSFSSRSTPYNVRVTVSNSQQSFTTMPLTISVSGTTPPNSCGTMTDANIYVVVSGCPGYICPAGSPITFFVQASGYDLSCSTHTFSWDFGDGPAVVATTTAQHTFLPRTEPYQVKVTIANPGQTFTTMPLNITVTTPPSTPCGTMTTASLYPVLQSPTACPGGVCSPNEPIAFTIQTNGYDFSCASHAFAWDFGDGTLLPSSSPSVQHGFTARTTPYPVKVTIANGTQTFTTASLSVTVAVVPVGCPTMTASSVYPVLKSPGACPGNVCPPNTTIGFTVQASGYDFACAPHIFAWDFGDGTLLASSTPAVEHSFASSSTPYAVKVTIVNSNQIFTTLPLSIQVNGAQSACPPMNDNNVYPAITPASLCPAWVCPASQPITFTLQTFGYSFSCAPYTFTWDFGDGVAVDGASTIQHAFAPRTDPYLVRVTIRNLGQTFTTLPLTISVKPAGYPANPGTRVSIMTEALGAVGAYRFTPVVDPGGVGIDFHWEVRAGGTNVVETADKVGPGSFVPSTLFSIGTTYIVTVTVDNVATASTTIMPAPSRRRASRH
jgi:PKD domain